MQLASLSSKTTLATAFQLVVTGRRALAITVANTIPAAVTIELLALSADCLALFGGAITVQAPIVPDPVFQEVGSVTVLIVASLFLITVIAYIRVSSLIVGGNTTPIVRFLSAFRACCTSTIVGNVRIVYPSVTGQETIHQLRIYDGYNLLLLLFGFFCPTRSPRRGEAISSTPSSTLTRDNTVTFASLLSFAAVQEARRMDNNAIFVKVFIMFVDV